MMGTTVVKCEELVTKMLTSVGPVVDMEGTLLGSCENEKVHKEVGGSVNECKKYMQELATRHGSDKNYFKWCRKVTLGSSEYLKSLADKLKSNQTIVKLSKQCGADCP